VPGSFTVWQLAPGRLELKVAGSEPANMVLRSTAGKVYLFRLSVTHTESGTRAVIESLPESYRGELASCRLIKNPRSITAQERAPMPQRQAKAPAASKTKQSARREEKPRHTARRHSPTVGGLSLQIRTGSLSLANQKQTILSQDRLFDKSASGLLGFGIDYQSSSGLSVGGEILNYKVQFVTSGLNDTHDVNVYALLANTKQYYLTDSNFQPYLGIGLGVAVTSISGPSISGNTVGFAYQLLAGMEYRHANLGFFAEARYLGASTKDSNNQKVDVSGSGIFAGVSFHY
jgi:opacity protein-like surface antigen